MMAGAAAGRRFEGYSEYRESSVAWIGRIPGHWEVSRTKRVARLRTGHTPSRQHPEYWENCTIPWFGLADVWQIRDGKRDVVTETNENISELGLANSAARLLPKGTVIVSRTASVGFSAILGVDMATTQDFVNWVCGPRIRPDYLLQVFRSMRQEFASLTMGSTHQTIYMPDVGQFSTPVPPLPEQQAIAGFLDRETAKIDALVAKTVRLIELVEESLAAHTCSLITGEAAAQSEFGDSRYGWFPRVPRTWRVVRLKDVARHVTVGIVITPTKYYAAAGLPLLRPVNVVHGRLDDADLVRISEEHHRQHRKSEVRPGDVVIVRSGQPGASAVVDAGFARANCVDMVIVRPSAALDPEFLVRVLNSRIARAQTEAMSDGAILQHFNVEVAREIRVPVPPRDEQRRLVAELVARRQRHDTMTRRLHEARQRLGEYRSALITAAVTGRIDVRGEVAA